MGWLIALGILILLAILPLGADVRYDSDGPLVRIVAGPIRLQVFPGKKKGKKDKKDKKEKKPKKDKKGKKDKQAENAASGKNLPVTGAKPAETAPEEKKGGSVLDFLPLVKLGINFLGDFRRKLRVNRLELNLVMAGGDPCDLAVNYGKAWAALGNLWPRLEEWFVIRKRDVRVQCDFEGSETLITARLQITITLGRIISLVVLYGIRALKQLLKINNKRKGGAAI
jgi:hypothetical protein